MPNAKHPSFQARPRAPLGWHIHRLQAPFLALWMVVASGGCSSLENVYAKAGYDAQGTTSVKHIVVAAWAPEQTPELDALMARIAADMIKVRKNYLVYKAVTAKSGFGEHCSAEIQGVLLLQALDISHNDLEIDLIVSAELFRCSDGALLWRASAQKNTDADDKHLMQLSAAYVREFGSIANQYAAPVFAILQDIIAALPNVVLSDEEILEKIELGAGSPCMPKTKTLPLSANLWLAADS